MLTVKIAVLFSLPFTRLTIEHSHDSTMKKLSLHSVDILIKRNYLNRQWELPDRLKRERNQSRATAEDINSRNIRTSRRYTDQKREAQYHAAPDARTFNQINRFTIYLGRTKTNKWSLIGTRPPTRSFSSAFISQHFARKLLQLLANWPAPGAPLDREVKMPGATAPMFSFRGERRPREAAASSISSRDAFRREQKIKIGPSHLDSDWNFANARRGRSKKRQKLRPWNEERKGSEDETCQWNRSVSVRWRHREESGRSLERRRLLYLWLMFLETEWQKSDQYSIRFCYV